MLLLQLKKLWVMTLTHPYKFNENPPPYDIEKHFWKLYKLRLDNIAPGYFDEEVLNTKIKIVSGVADEATITAAIRKLMNGVEYENTKASEAKPKENQ